MEELLIADKQLELINKLTNNSKNVPLVYPNFGEEEVYDLNGAINIAKRFSEQGLENRAGLRYSPKP